MSRRSLQIVGALALLSAAAVATSWLDTARAQDELDQAWFAECPTAVGTSGRLVLVNGTDKFQPIAVVPSGTSSDIITAINEHGSFDLPAGASTHVDFTVTQASDEVAESCALQVLARPGVVAFLEVDTDSGAAGTRPQTTNRARTDHVIPLPVLTDQHPSKFRLGFVIISVEVATVTATLEGSDGSTLAEGEVMFGPDTGELIELEHGTLPAGVTPRAIRVTSTQPVLADASYDGPGGFTFLSGGRDLAELGAFWYPYVNQLDLGLGLASTGPTYSSEVRFFDSAGTAINGAATLTTEANDLDTVPPFNGGPVPIIGATCVEVVTGAAPRGPSYALGLAGDLEVMDPMQRIAPGFNGAAPVRGDDPVLVANGAVLLNNPSNIDAVGVLRLRDAAGRVLVEKKVRVKSLNNVVIPLKKLVKKKVTAAYVELVNPPLVLGAKPGGGTFHAAVIDVDAPIGHKKKAKGEGNRLVVHALRAFAAGGPTIVAPEVTKADNDKKATLLMEGRAANISKNARLQLLDETIPPYEWKLKPKSVIKLKLKAKSLETKVTLASLWPVGEERSFVIVDGAETSEPVLIRRGEDPVKR